MKRKRRHLAKRCRVCDLATEHYFFGMWLCAGHAAKVLADASDKRLDRKRKEKP